MKLSKFSFAFFAFFMLINKVYADSCYLSHDILHNAEEVVQSARDFHHSIHHLTGYSHLASDTHKLIRTAAHLEHLADLGIHNCSHLRKDFRKVQQKFHHLQHAFKKAHRAHHNHHVVHDWRDLKNSVRRLGQTFRGHHH